MTRAFIDLQDSPNVDEQMMGTDKVDTLTEQQIAGDSYDGASAFEQLLSDDNVDVVDDSVVDDVDEAVDEDVDNVDEDLTGSDDDEEQTNADDDEAEADDTEEAEEEVEAEKVELDDDTEIEVDGATTTIAELKQDRLRFEEHKVAMADLAVKQQGVVDTMLLFTQNLGVAATETSELIKEYDAVDWAKVSPEDYQVHQERLKGLQAKQKQQREAFNSVNGVGQAGLQANRQEKAQAAFKQLNEQLPLFNREVYNSMLTHAVDDLGVARATANGITDANLLTALHNSMMYTQGQTALKGTKPKKKVVLKAKANKGTTSGKRAGKNKPTLNTSGSYNADAARSAFESIL